MHGCQVLLHSTAAHHVLCAPYAVQDESGKELELMVAEGAKSIKLPVGQGIAGSVAATGGTINIADAYKDSRFDRSHDQATGYTTKTILCAPVKDGSGRTVGVIQAINKAGGASFTPVDEEILVILATQVCTGWCCCCCCCCCSFLLIPTPWHVVSCTAPPPFPPGWYRAS